MRVPIFFLTFFISFNICAQYKIKTNSNITLPVPNEEPELFADYEKNTAYFVRFLEPADFQTPASGYFSSDSPTNSEGTLVYRSTYSNRLPSRAFNNSILSILSYSTELNQDIYTSLNTSEEWLGIHFFVPKTVNFAVLRPLYHDGEALWPNVFKFQGLNSNNEWIDISSTYNPPINRANNKGHELAIYKFNENNNLYFGYRIFMQNGSVFSGYQYIESLFFY